MPCSPLTALLRAQPARISAEPHAVSLHTNCLASPRRRRAPLMAALPAQLTPTEGAQQCSRCRLVLSCPDLAPLGYIWTRTFRFRQKANNFYGFARVCTVFQTKIKRRHQIQQISNSTVRLIPNCLLNYMLSVNSKKPSGTVSWSRVRVYR